jgi:hypothetical protein
MILYMMFSYDSNYPMARIATNGRYLVAPTSRGKVFIWNINSGALTAVLSDRRNASFFSTHTYSKLILMNGFLLCSFFWY